MEAYGSSLALGKQMLCIAFWFVEPPPLRPHSKTMEKASRTTKSLPFMALLIGLQDWRRLWFHSRIPGLDLSTDLHGMLIEPQQQFQYRQYLKVSATERALCAHPTEELNRNLEASLRTLLNPGGARGAAGPGKWGAA